jgi:hypothetical protein
VALYKGYVLALDISTNIGWAFGAPGAPPEFGHLTLLGSTRAGRYRYFRTWLDAFTGGRPPSLIVFEAPMLPGGMKRKTNYDTQMLLIGLAEHLEEWAHDRIELREARVPAIRHHFIGGNYKSAIAKPMTMRRCHALGWMAETQDEADALALWDYQVCHLRPDLATGTTALFAKGASR